MEKEWILMVQQNQLGNLLKTNQKTEKFGLSISEQDAEMILQERKNALQEQKRIEFGEGIVQKIIYEFCDSDYIDQNNYVNTIIRLQEIFYLYKNEMNDELSIFAQAIRAGYRGFQKTEGRQEYEQFDEVQRWDYELYLETLKNLCWE